MNEVEVQDRLGRALYAALLDLRPIPEDEANLEVIDDPTDVACWRDLLGHLRTIRACPGPS